MENWRLESCANDAKDVIDSLISEIEDLESQMKIVSEHRNSLLEEIEALKSEIEDMKNGYSV